MISFSFFSPPDGKIFKNPDLGFLKTLILYAESLYWNSGAGQANIDIETDGKTRHLILTFDVNFGFMLEFHILGEPIFVSLGDGTFDESTTVYIGGVPEEFPSKFFITREEAWEAVEYFCETGELCDEITWGKLEDQNWK